jgi:hypothetical protein
MSESRNRTLAADHGAVPRGGTTAVPARDRRELHGLDRDTTRAEELAEWQLNKLLERRHAAPRRGAACPG